MFQAAPAVNIRSGRAIPIAPSMRFVCPRRFARAMSCDFLLHRITSAAAPIDEDGIEDRVR
ncbi:hypothetical protein [Methylobacterium trifolii]|uniref:hypothetical protein n=1 Tax=Methylobacterium trifolii TaxID=1003092 RepID=UPI001EDDAD20|nr:hypothetical protein [Methylobacterium trifolii]